MEDDPDPSIVRALSKIRDAPIPKKMTPKSKKKFVVESVDWLQKNDGGSFDTVDDATAASSTKFAGVSYDGPAPSSAARKGSAMEDAVS